MIHANLLFKFLSTGEIKTDFACELPLNKILAIY